ncbi:MAG: class I SAM-dependent methyltransferase [Candidatus Cloacimonetes bacterium]|nr:class I SAM-dependent methyltransferase [Candidatus Cloacimonadota bacterium]
MGSEYRPTASWYDVLYESKDYAAESSLLLDLLRERGVTCGSLLDVACGTGRHLEHLGQHFSSAAGLDICPELLEFARRRNPGLTFYQADMTDFALGSSFDVITCLFSAIGHMVSLDMYADALRCFHKRLEPSGWLLIEPWIEPDSWRAGTVHMQTVDRPELKIARVSNSGPPVSRGGALLSVFDLHHLIATPQETRHIVEHFEMALYTRQEQLDLFEREGFESEWIEPGLTGRGLLLGKKQ